MLKSTCFALLLLIVGTSVTPVAAEPKWEARARDDGPGYRYQVFSQTAPGEDFVRYQVRGTVQASAQKLSRSVRAITSDPSYAQEGHTRRVVETSPKSFVVHTSIEVPFFSDRDIVTHGVTSVDAASGVHRIEWRATDDPRVPAQPEVVRIDQAGGYWEFAPNPDGTTRVTYETYIDLGGSIPKWLANRLMPGTVAENFTDVAAEAQKTAASVSAAPPERAPSP